MWPAYNMSEGITVQYKLCQQHLTKHHVIHVLQASQMPIQLIMQMNSCSLYHRVFVKRYPIASVFLDQTVTRKREAKGSTFRHLVMTYLGKSPARAFSIDIKVSNILGNIYAFSIRAAHTQ